MSSAAGRDHGTGPILVTGGTGTLGRLVVSRLQASGRTVRVLTRRSREAGERADFVTGDLATGKGIQAAVDGAEIIVHCAGSSKGDEDKARNLVEAATRAGAPHLVYISVVGADRIPVVSRVDRALFGYFAAKLAAESVVAESGLPWTTLRATQFHDLTLTTVRQMARLRARREGCDGGGEAAERRGGCELRDGSEPCRAMFLGDVAPDGGRLGAGHRVRRVG